MIIDIKPHERDALEGLVRAGRAIADVLGAKDDRYKDTGVIGSMRAWAQIVEDMLERGNCRREP